MAKVLPTLRYTRTHEWIKVEGDTATVGISDFAQAHLGSIVFVDMPSVGDTFSKDQEFGAVESVKAASDLYLPVSGEVIEVNSALEDEPDLINGDAYEHFIVKIKLSDPKELDELLDASGYEAFCAQEK